MTCLFVAQNNAKKLDTKTVLNSVTELGGTFGSWDEFSSAFDRSDNDAFSIFSEKSSAKLNDESIMHTIISLQVRKVQAPGRL